MIPNTINQENKDFYISYNTKDVAIYNSSTTALVISKTYQFLILDGDHRKEYKKLTTLEECVKYFYDHIDKVNVMSEHGKIFKGGRYMKGGY